jgi:Na+-transporting methylmalonyl-CoA/oxaloacetate decarboxylase gamma subunit
LAEGLLIAFAGMGMTLGVLVLIVLVVEGLTRLFPAGRGEVTPATKERRAKQEASVAAAAAVALFLAGDGGRILGTESAAPLLKAKASSWRIVGRESLMRSRGLQFGTRRKARRGR